MTITTAHVLGQDASQLVECQQGFLLLPEVCKAFKAMQAAAQKDDIDLQIVSSYRDFHRQLQIWQNKWAGHKVILDIDEHPIDIHSLTDEEKVLAILTWSALPGASRHHWGTDLDVYDKQAVIDANHDFQLVCSEYDQGPCVKLNHWLSEHAEDYGFYRPYAECHGGIAREPWHISFKTSAETMLGLLCEDNLLASLKQANISGFDSIKNKLPEIFQRFVLNKGTT